MQAPDRSDQVLSEQHARAWLRKMGFDPDGDLCSPQPSKRNPEVVSTAMYEACAAGGLDICFWLVGHGAAKTLRTSSSSGATPMFIACQEGHLEVAKWLLEVGGAEDVRTPNSSGAAPMFIAARWVRTPAF